jgi:hypothetical protein
MLIAFVIDNHRTVLHIEHQSLAAVNDATAGGDRIHIRVGLIQREGELEHLATRRLPVLEIPATGVGEVVIGCAVRGIAPNPNKME